MNEKLIQRVFNYLHYHQMKHNSSRVTWHMVEERVCKDCGYVFYPRYSWQFMTCFCSDPVHVDWTPEYVRIVWDATKIRETGEEFPCCFTISLEERQQDLRKKMLLADHPQAPTIRDYSLYYKQKVEWKIVKS